MGIEDELGKAADQAKKVVTGSDEDKQKQQQFETADTSGSETDSDGGVVSDDEGRAGGI
ncbi:hypothetical protein [Streptomyces sp. WAC 01529]|uniref:hypothetical protein n=1 Tax=Streptomyces sp. WAC 01529 TaxID=2203205 RepID=UPI0013E06CD4|nr:hypothetical protein [Streptomyces sp. WAC 01529]